MNEGLAYLQGPLEEGALSTAMRFTFLWGLCQRSPATHWHSENKFSLDHSSVPKHRISLVPRKSTLQPFPYGEKPNRYNRRVYFGGDKAHRQLGGKLINLNGSPPAG